MNPNRNTGMAESALGSFGDGARLSITAERVRRYIWANQSDKKVSALWIAKESGYGQHHVDAAILELSAAGLLEAADKWNLRVAAY